MASGGRDMIKFISYDGKYPNLCSGTLTIEIDGELKILHRVLVSGGTTNWRAKYPEPDVISGPWMLDRWETERNGLTQEQHDSLREIANKEIRNGCCGGCL
jgi:hypothetical protein